MWLLLLPALFLPPSPKPIGPLLAAGQEMVRPQKRLMIADFEEEDILGCIGANQGVTIALTDKDAASGKRALEVRVAPFSVHQNQWPSVFLGPKLFTTPVDVSFYSKLSVSVRKVTEGLATLWITYSTLPYNDGGRNLEGKGFTIPGGTTKVCDVPTASFDLNDPSAIQLMYLTFPPSETEAVYRIDAVRAMYDATEGSPAEKLREGTAALSRQFRKLKQTMNWEAILGEEQRSWEDKLAGLDRKIQGLAGACAHAETGGFRGQYKARKEELAELTRQLGKFTLAGKKGFFAWEIDPYINVLRDEAPNPDSAPLERIDVHLAQGEFRDKVFMVSSCGQDLRLEVRVAPDADAARVRPLPEGVVLVQETVYMKNRSGQETGDAVWPLRGPLVVPKGESRQIRLRFDARYGGLRAGRYSLRLILRNQDSGVEKVVPGTAEVWSFRLPDYDVLANNSYTEFDSSQFGEGGPLAKAVAHMKAYGLNIVYVHPIEMPVAAQVDADDRIVRFNDVAFTNRVRPILQAWKAAPGNEALKFIFSVSGFYDFGLHRDDIRFPGPKWRTVCAQWLKHLKDTMASFGVASKDWMLVLGDEASESALVQNEIPMAEAIKSIDPSIKITCNTSTVLSDPAMSECFLKAFDVFQPELTSLKSNPYLLSWLRKSGKTLWTYKCSGNLGARGKNVYEYYRVYGWDLVKYGLTGTGVWTYCAQAQAQRDAGYVLIHNREGEVMHSRRFELFREGLDDYRYLWALRDAAQKRGPRAAAKAEKLIREAVADVTSNVLDTGRCDKWRMRIAREILSAYPSHGKG